MHFSNTRSASTSLHASHVQAPLKGRLQLRHVLKAMKDGVRYVFQAQDCSNAFAENSFGHKQQFLRLSVVQSAGLRLRLSIPSAMPSLMQMRSTCVGGRDVPLNDAFAPFRASSQKSALCLQWQKVCMAQRTTHQHLFLMQSFGLSVCAQDVLAASCSPRLQSSRRFSRA